MMRMKRSMLFVIVTLMLLLTCCTNVNADLEQVSEPTGTVEQDEAPGKAAEEEVVTTIYLLDRDKFVSREIPNYNVFNRGQNRRVEFKEFPMDQMEAMYASMTKEILAGSGPDIIYLNGYLDQYVDIHRVVEQGALVDMDTMIAQDDDINMEDYNSVIIDAGIIDGTRVMIPIGYNMGYLTGMQECLDYHEFPIPDQWTMDDYLALLENYYATTSEPALLGMSNVRILRSAIEGRDLNEERFIRLAKIFKEEYNRIRNFPRLNFEGYMQYFRDNNLLFLDRSGDSDYFNILRDYNYMLENNDATLFMQEFPREFYVRKGFMINTNSKHKEAAFDFIQYMLSEDIQKQETAAFSSMPVNKLAMESRKKNFEEAYNYEHGEKVPVPDEFRDQIYAYHDSIDTCHYTGYVDFVYHNFIEELLYDYFEGKIDEQELNDSVKSKLFIYFTE